MNILKPFEIARVFFNDLLNKLADKTMVAAVKGQRILLICEEITFSQS
ncbi:MAG: hypothetical protein JO327_02205 [Nitrososphaeraceae archaeon]|nr:hypothetical protein [Nitrososphaeraceae archaeon]MBV9666924.1 hypothetical protein [Nitrososphaeraceae archaeon]